MSKTDYNITFKLCKDSTKKKYKEYKIFINDVETRYSIRGDGTLFSYDYRRSGKKKKLKPGHNKDGYCFSHISVNGKDYSILLHKLVALAFIKNPKNLSEVNHKNLNKDDNCYKNLEWITRKGNIDHAIQNKAITYHCGEEHHCAKMTNKKVHKICKMLEKNYTITDVSEKYNVSTDIVYRILHKKLWTSISDEYDFSKHTARGNTKLTEEDVHQICRLYINTNKTMKEIGQMFNVSKGTIQSIIRGKNWVNISSQYTFTR